MVEPNEENKKWEEYTKGYVSFAMQSLSEYFHQTSKNKVSFRPYGSSAEGLKLYLPHDVGDVDVMVFSTAKEMEITEDMLENVPNQPGFVRIRAANHPVLKSCLLEDTGYVATAALKKLHPEIYGEVSRMAGLTTKIVAAMSSKENPVDLNFTQKFENSADGPAATLDFAQSFGSLTKQVEDLRDPTCFQNSPSAFENIAAAVCEARGVPYTKQHAALFDSYMKYAMEQIQQASKNGTSILTDFPRLANDLIQGPRARELGRLREELEADLVASQIESSEAGSAPKQEITPIKGEKAKSAGNIAECGSEGREMQESGSQNEKYSAEHRATRSSDRSKSEPEPEVCVQGHNDVKENERERSISSSETSSEPSKEQCASTALSVDAIIDHLLGITDADQKDGSAYFTEAASKHDRRGGGDFVPALQGRGWPQIAQEWCTRPRHWPSCEVVEKIAKESFHVVVKTPWTGGNPDLDFRLSFSHAEYLLSQEMNELQKECYRCLKLLHRAYFCTEEKVITTYHLKTLLLWTSEETGLEFWSEENRSVCVLTLVDKLLEALERKSLPHYFISCQNLFDHAAKKYPELLDSLAEKVKEIRRNPTCFDWERVLKRSTTKPENSGHDSSRETNSNSAAAAAVHPVPAEKSLRYHEFQDQFLDVAREVVTLALSGEDVPTDDPILSELVTDIRAVAKKHTDLTVDDFVSMFKSFTSMSYMTFQLNSDTDIRQRMLGELKGKIKMIKYCVEQEEICIAGKEDAMVQKLLDPNGGFDLSQVLPAGCGVDLMRGMLNFLEPAPTAKNVEPEDIPLD